jgi:archaemetzincin
MKFLILILVLLVCGCVRTANQMETVPVEPQKDETTQIEDRRALKLIKIKETVAPFFQPMKIRDGDWLESFSENGQTFEEYLNNNPTLPTTQRQKIYIQPIGDFSVTQRKMLRLTADYMKAFYNLPVSLNTVKSLKDVPKAMIRDNPYDGQKQIKTTYFLENVLPKMLPEDAAAFICFTNSDLYPNEDWNFVFGQASLENRVGVWSLWRFGNPDKSAEDYKLFLTRTLKIAMHETGHMFSIRHCTKYECLMSGTNHLAETDRRPLDFCPECMSKVAWAMKYEPVERYQNLADFCEKQGWMHEQKTFDEKAKAISIELR